MIWILSNTVECAMAFYMRPFLFVQFCTMISASNRKLVMRNQLNAIQIKER